MDPPVLALAEHNDTVVTDHTRGPHGHDRNERPDRRSKTRS